MKLWVGGCCGYVGSLLVPYLLSREHKIVGFDSQMFGNGFLPDNENLKLLKGDVRDTKIAAASMYGCETVIYLAGLTNNDAYVRDKSLGDSINIDAFEPLVIAAKASGIKRFILLSTAAIFGGETLYTKAKKYAEERLKYHQSKDFQTIILRSASVCGYAPRMRFDLPINRMVRDAFIKGEIMVNGGNQMRTHVHIRDLIVSIHDMLDRKSDVWNLCAENLSIMDVAVRVKEQVGGSITVKEATDDRSYEMKTDLATSYTVKDAIREMLVKFQSGYWKDAMTHQAYENKPAFAGIPWGPR